MSVNLRDTLAYECEQALCNAVVWAVIPAGIELFFTSSIGELTCTVAGLAALEQLLENRVLHCVPTKARRIVPLAVTTGVVAAFLLAEGGINHLAEATSIASLSSLTFAFIKSMTSKPYPRIVPIVTGAAHTAKSFASNLPYVGRYLQEKPKLF